MKRMMWVLFVVVIWASGPGCVIPDPTSRRVSREAVYGERPGSGERIIARSYDIKYLYALTPVGRIDSHSWTEFVIRDGKSEERLRFLEREFESGLMFQRFIPLEGTTRWAALRRTRNDYECVELLIFDRDGIRSRHVIAGVTVPPRIDLPSPSVRLTFKTRTGVVAYDAKTDQLMNLPETNPE